MAKRVIKLGGKSKTIISDYIVSEFNGLNTFVKDIKQLADGETPDSLNWMTGKQKDSISLRGGYALLGTTRNAGTGRITGLGVGMQSNGTQVPFFTYLRKIKYYNATTRDTAEVSATDILPSLASGDDVSVMPYQNLAGSFVYLTSPNSSIYKIVVCNPATAVDQQSTAFRGTAKIGQTRMFLWNRLDSNQSADKLSLYLSVSDFTTISQYTQVTKLSSGTGDGSNKTFTGTVQAGTATGNVLDTIFYTEFAAPIAAGVVITGISKATNAVITVSSHSFVAGNPIIINSVSGMTEINNLIGFVQSVTATTITTNINSTAFTTYSSAGDIYLAEYFIDDKNGNLNSNAGGTGTINYATNVFSLTFITAPINSQHIYAQVYLENATSGGVCDFLGTGSALYSQNDGGGNMQSVVPFDQVEYCFHQLKTWYLNLNASTPTNLQYRSLLGLPYFRAAYPTDNFIFFLDTSNPAQPKAKTLTIDNANATAVVTVVPDSISEKLDLSSFGFNLSAAFTWGDYNIFVCAATLNGVVQTVNTVMFAMNIYTNQWDKLDYCASCFAQYNGTLLAGDSLTNNVFTLFSGFDDDGALINNYWTSKLFNLGIEGLKNTNRFTIRGLIQQTQNIDIYFAYDNGNFVKVATVNGNGNYVNVGSPTIIGSNTSGSTIVGGGGSTVVGYPYEVDFTIASDLYEYVQVKFVANNIGYCQIDEFGFKDNRLKSRSVLPTSTM